MTTVTLYQYVENPKGSEEGKWQEMERLDESGTVKKTVGYEIIELWHNDGSLSLPVPKEYQGIRRLDEDHVAHVRVLDGGGDIPWSADKLIAEGEECYFKLPAGGHFSTTEETWHKVTHAGKEK